MMNWNADMPSRWHQTGDTHIFVLSPTLKIVTLFHPHSAEITATFRILFDGNNFVPSTTFFQEKKAKNWLWIYPDTSSN